MRSRLEAHPELDAELLEAWARATARWPAIALAPERFGAALGERLDEGITLGELRADDLFLATALLDDLPGALDAFERAYGPEIDRGLRRLDPEGFDDLRQTVRQRLLVGDGERPPKLAAYGARGELLRWLRVTVVRMRADVVRRRLREPTRDDGSLGSRVSRAVSPAADPEARYLKDHYGDELRAAFEGAVERLRPKQRNLLRQHLLGGLSATQLAGLYNVDRSTTKRWLAKARQELWSNTRRGVMLRLGLSRDEFDSIIRMVHSELHLSIPRLLGPEGEPPPDPS